MDQESSSAVEQVEQANRAEIAAVEERTPVPEAGAEREPARDDRGRFQPKPLDENSLRSRIDLEEVRNARLLSDALESGLIIPDDEMDMSLWAKSFRGRLAQAERSGGSTPPQPVESESESTDSEAEPGPAGGPDQEILNAYQQRVATFAAENPDFSEVVGELALPRHVAPVVELAILQEALGPQIAYQLGRNPELVSELGKMTPAQAASQVGRMAEWLEGQNYVREQVGITTSAFDVEIPGNVLAEFHQKSRRLHESNPLSEEELERAQAISINPYISKMIIAMDAPEIVHHLMRNPHEVARLNRQHPLGVAASLAEIRAELTERGSGQTGKAIAPADYAYAQKHFNGSQLERQLVA